jgi:pyruvate/2-oxoglutarate dehydrogenase complex dihydrolipoamide acyltransferase (E2) component
VSTGGGDSWDEGSDESSLSSFEDSDADARAAEATPPAQAQATASVAAHAAAPSAAAAASAEPAVAAAAAAVEVDQAVDQLVMEWCAGKSIVEMLATLPELWLAAQPRNPTDELNRLLSLPPGSPETYSPEGRATVRREYLRCVRKVHPDKVSVLLPEDYTSTLSRSTTHLC